MKNHLTLFVFIILIGMSCSENRTIEDDLVGEWIYERETFTSGSTFVDTDTKGIMTFNEDETGTWLRDNGSAFPNEIEWDLQRMDTKISITRFLFEPFEDLTTSQIYNITQSGEDSFTFTYEVSFESSIDTFESFNRFENIILTRI